MEKLLQQLRQDEGFRGIAYQDSLGNWTIGYGHLLSNPITERAATEILQDDVNIAIRDFASLPHKFRKNLNEARRRVVINMLFNMGLGRFLTFKKMIQAVIDEEFEQAALEMLDSVWAKQVKGRAVRLAEIMKYGG